MIFLQNMLSLNFSKKGVLIMKKICSIIIAIAVVISLFSSIAYAKDSHDKGNAFGAKSKTQTTKVKKNIQDTTSIKAESSNKHVSVLVKGKEVKFDVPPVLKYGRTLIPVRAITNALGADLQLDSETGTITITKDDITIVITIGSGVATINGKEVQMGAPADVMNNRTFVPIRFIAEALKQKVEWDQDTGSVIVDDNSSTTPEGTDTGTTTTGSTDTTNTGTTTDSGTGTTDQTGTASDTTTTPTDSSSSGSTTGTSEVPTTNQ
jgi:uncharacterized protein YxeA